MILETDGAISLAMDRPIPEEAPVIKTVCPGSEESKKLAFDFIVSTEQPSPILAIDCMLQLNNASFGESSSSERIV